MVYIIDLLYRKQITCALCMDFNALLKVGRLVAKAEGLASCFHRKRCVPTKNCLEGILKYFKLILNNY